MSEDRSRGLANDFVVAAVAQVEDRVRLAVKECEKQLGEEHGGEVAGGRLKAVVASGGVASNAYLRMR